ncbi:ATPase involved in chromosome partitioning [Azospira oryzae PS]|uniref:ATPase involved in chromosome partitioning n=1 Tax=Azospira oryzae (strain ATCC BAA-33 / DSM 13638 / PS) TaxID=640081 RepID=G8QJB4_AZOOP|nr:ParA family protein [Azospira oryzae]AEV27583.1 ATPase involved in chromosome partitioning [Azospira oryzae PS]
MPRLAIFNQKGGVGKTTTTLNLAAASIRHNRPPLLLDLDPQGHLSSIHGGAPNQVEHTLYSFYQDNRPLGDLEQPWPEIGTLIPSHQQLIKVDSIYGKGPTILNKLRLGLNHLEESKGERVTLIDCCPYVGVLALNAIFAVERVLIPVSTDFLSLQAAFHMARTLDILEPVLKRRVARRYVLTRFDRRRRMSEDIRQRLCAAFGDEVCRTAISENVAVAESPSLNQDVFTHAFASNGAQDYLALHDELRGSDFL